MKILNLKIKTPSHEIVRDISFSEFGISFIYGDIRDPSNRGATINSLGKTLLINMIDYIYGANENNQVMKKELENYILEARVKYLDREYSVTRIIGSSSSIYIDNEPKTLSEYKEFFCIERRLYDKQILKNKKLSELSQNVKNPGKSDYIDFIRLLELENLIEPVSKIYDSQDIITQYKNNKKDLISFYDDLNLKQIDEEIYFVDEEVKRLSAELKVISNKIKKIEISEIQQNVIEEYSNKSNELKILKAELEHERLELCRLEDFISNSNKVDITSEHVLKIYEKSKLEIPDMIKRKLDDVEKFHKKVYEERKEFLSSKISVIKERIEVLINNISTVSADVDDLGNLISINEVYQESISLYEKYNIELQQLKFREGKLSQIKNIDTEIDKESKKLTEDFEKANEIMQSYNELVILYRNYLNELSKSIYNSEVSCYFKLEIIKRHLKHRPIKLELSMRGDTGEGVGEVKKNLVDYLLFRYNNLLDLLIQDSACFNGIDPRQVCNMVTEISKIADLTQKQAIIAINKYQLGSYQESINFVVENSPIILSEDDKLLKFDF